MRGAGSHYRAGRRFIPALLGWILAAMIVLGAVFGPPLTGQSVPTMVELRHDVLMIDREFERWTIADPSSDKPANTLAEARRDS
jgi:hypothetical protein